MNGTVEPEAPAPDPERLDRALLIRLDLEHEALWLLGVVGGRVSALRDRATDAYSTHRAARDALLDTLHDRDAPTSAPRASYGEPPTGREASEAAVADLQRRITAACLAVVTATPADQRPDALADLRAAALATLAWGGAPEAFPGLD